MNNIKVWYEQPSYISDVFDKLFPPDTSYHVSKIETDGGTNIVVTFDMLETFGNRTGPRDFVLNMEDWRGGEDKRMGNATIEDRGLNDILESGFALRLIPKVINKTGAPGVLMLEPAPVSEVAKDTEPERILNRFKRDEITNVEAWVLIRSWAENHLWEETIEDEVVPEDFDVAEIESLVGLSNEEIVERRKIEDQRERSAFVENDASVYSDPDGEVRVYPEDCYYAGTDDNEETDNVD